MPEDSVYLWSERLRNATKYHNEWWYKFKCDTSYRYYEGQQWEGYESYYRNYKPYVINLIYSTLEVKLPSLLFQVPIYHVRPKPIRMYLIQSVNITKML